MTDLQQDPTTNEPGLNRRRFVQASAAMGGGLALAGPLSALASAQSAQGAPRRAIGYGPLLPTPAQDTGIAHIALPEGFRYRVIARQGEPSTAFADNGARQTVPLPGIFDGTGAFAGPNGQTILILNHENRQTSGEIPVVVPASLRYDPNPRYNAGNTRLVVGSNRRVRNITHVLGGTAVNCAGGETPWGSWITCEETFIPEGPSARKHGYCFEIDSRSDRPVRALPIRAAGAFAHEAVAYRRGILYQTEDAGKGSGFYRYRPTRTPRRAGDLAQSTGPLEAIRIKGRPNFDADTMASPGETFAVDWVPIPDPDPATNTVKVQGLAAGMVSFSRLEGCWVGGNKIYFDATSGGPAGLGQVWEYDPQRELLRLLYQSTDPAFLQSPDNLIVVPQTNDVWLQEDGAGEQFIRGVTQRGQIYDFAQTIVNDTEFCGGCFSPDGETFFVSQQGNRGITDPARIDAEGAVMYAIWGPFDNRSGAEAPGTGGGGQNPGTPPPTDPPPTNPPPTMPPPASPGPTPAPPTPNPGGGSFLEQIPILGPILAGLLGLGRS